ncbi:MAG: saccharopine dehydrogenase NADP-binding domain-containing protein [Anaerovoracaceae bacterium]
MKKIVILGVGAQGSTVAKFIDKDENVKKIICADYDEKAVKELVKELSKGEGAKVDASSEESIIKVIEGADLVVNGLPLAYGKNVLEACLKVGADYQDFAATEAIHEDWVEGIKILYKDYAKRFEEIGRVALIATGSAPGLILVVTRDLMKHFDSCDTIYNFVYEGVEAKRFLPFWWSPVTAMNDMAADATAFVDGKLVKTIPFSLPVSRKYDYLDDEVVFVEHDHDEPVHIGLNAEEFFKGVKNVYFKYAGAGVEFAKPLYRAGLLSHKKEQVKDVMVAPFDVVLKHIPAAPKYHDEIKGIIEEGLISDTGAMVVEAYGLKDGVKIKAESHVSAPGLKESFEKSGLTSEMYLTGQGGALFTKMLIKDLITQRGLISSDMLNFDQVAYYLKEAEKLNIIVETKIEKL